MTLKTSRLARIACAFVVTLSMLPCALRADAVGDARQLMAEGKHADALKLIDQQLFQRRDDIGRDERYALLMLKGDGLLQTGKSSLAATAFDQANRAAPDGKSAAVARAHVLLVRASQQGKYRPKSSAGAEVIDIANPDSRQAALEALRGDLADAAKPRIARASQSRTLNAAMDLMPAIMDLAAVELAAKGTTDETRADIASLSEHCQGLMNAQIDQCRRVINSLGDQAMMVEIGRTRGLQSNEMKDMEKITAELKRIEKVARDVRRRAQEIGRPGTEWEQIATNAADLIDGAERVMEFGAQSTRD